MKRVIIALVIVLIAGLVYWLFVGPTNARWERKFNKHWFSSEYNENDLYKSMVIKFGVEKDLTIIVYLSEEYQKFDKLPEGFINQVNSFVRTDTARENNLVLFKYYDKLIYP